MNSSFYQSVLATFLALLLLFGGTAKEWLHQCTPHQDTVHYLLVGDEGLSFDKEHHHCGAISAFLAFWEAAQPILFTPKANIAYYPQFHVEAVSLLPLKTLAFGTRGPPAV